MSTAAKINAAGKPERRSKTKEDREWSSMQKTARKVEEGWRYFWAQRGVEPPTQAGPMSRDFDFTRAGKRTPKTTDTISNGMA